MDSYWKLTLKIGMQTALVIGLLCACTYVYAQLQNQAAVISSSVNVFPGNIESVGWENTEAILNQNLSGDALYQDFNSINSAHIPEDARPDRVRRVQLDDRTRPATSTPVATTTTSDAQIDAGTQATSTRMETAPTNSDSAETEATASSTQDELQTPVAATTTIDDAPAVAPPATTAASTTPTPPVTPTATSGTTTVFKRMTQRFALAFTEAVQKLPFVNETATTSDGTTDTEVQEAAPTAEEAAAEDTEEEVLTAPAPTNETTAATSSVVSEETNVATTTDSNTAATPASTTASSSTTQSSSTSSPTTETNSEPTAATPSDTSAPTDTSAATDEATASVDDAADTTGAFTLTMRDFWLPMFDDADTKITGGQVRVSMAAQRKETRLDEVAALQFQYSLDDGASWSDAGGVTVADEMSNSINGDYFLFALPVIDSADNLENLAVRIVYEGKRSTVEDVFIDAAWLELFTVTGAASDVDALAAFDDNFNNAVLEGDELVLPDGERITFDFTDENHGEDLIVKSNDVTYNGLSEAVMYFNVTNESDRADEFSVKTYFPDDVGSVTSLQVWNQNKPRRVVIPEYRPFVYHCDGGWVSEIPDTAKTTPNLTLPDLATPRPDASTTPTRTPAATSSTATSTAATTSVPTVPTTTPEQSTAATTTSPEPAATSVESSSTTSGSTTVQAQWFNPAPFVQAAATTTRASSTTASTSVTNANIVSTGDYYCPQTNVVQTCDVLANDDTDCRVEKRRVAEHEKTAYRSGWEDKPVSSSTENTNAGRLARLGGLLGVGPAVKPVPEGFEARATTPDQFAIQPGETRYFKMTIAFPPFTSGEFWIEAIGTKAYGLLDPFWSSQWRYRKPITIDNTSGSELTEQQVFVELTSADSDFWTNVQSDGGDIRFVREVDSGQAWYDTDWSERIPIAVQSSQVDSDLTDFPVYVDLADLGSDFFSEVASDGADIRVTTGDGLTEVPIEVVDIDTGAKTGQLHFLASSTLSSSADTTFYLYYGNESATAYAADDPYGSENVWDSTYEAVYHLEEDAAGTGNSGLYQDATANNRDADDEISSTGKTGKLGQGQEIRARESVNDDHIIFPSANVNSLNAQTVSFWINTTQSGDQALINGGANNDYLVFLTGGGDDLSLYNGGNTTLNNLDTPISDTPATWRYVTFGRDSNNNEWRIFVDGVEDSGSPVSRTLSSLSIPGNCLLIGLEQDSSCLSSGDNTQHLDALIDQVTFRNTIPSAAEVAATYRNQATSSDFYATSTPQTQQPNTFTELDHWTQHFDYSGQEADIWVQVDTMAAAASTTIHLYYGNSEAESTSDEFAPFTYSTTTDLYYVVNDSQSNPIVVYSLIDNNQVRIDGGTPITLQAGETTSFSTYASTSVISALGPITARSSDDASEPPAPIGFATTTHIVSTNRNNEDFYVYSPFNTANVSVFEGANVTESASSTVAAGAADTYNVNLSGTGGIVEADEPILLYHNNDTDSYVAYPPTLRDLYGIHSNQWYVTPLAGSTNIDVFCSSGATGTETGLARGGIGGNSICTNGGQGSGDGVRLANQTSPIGATQQADSDGNESTRWLPTPEFGTIYYFPQDAEYVSVVCAPRFGSVDLEIQDTTGGTITSATCTPGTETPGAVNFTTAAPYTQGYSVVSTNDVPFYTYYEDDGTNDETNTWSAVQARQYDSLDSLAYTVGAEEENTDAQYEQDNFAWYENLDAQTPTDLWPAEDGGTVSEGEAIGSGGAVNQSDVVRLRMNLLANNGTGTVDSSSFTLQYAQADTCSSVVSDAWVSLADAGSTTAAFAGYNNGGVADGSTLSSTLLSDSDVAASYEEENFSAALPNEVGQGQRVEFDWTITAVDPAVNSQYCFRMIRSTQAELTTYTGYPQLLTAGPPETPSLLVPFDNEHATSTTPDLRFVASDLGGDDLDYEIEIATDADFGSVVVSSDSDSDPFDFENVANGSDKAPFNNGQTVRYLLASSLTNGQTYWWRVRAVDPDGSNTYSNYSSPRSFTINTSGTVTEWFQTTDDQFETNTLTSATTSGSGSVELNIAGSNLIGEYGSIGMTNGVTSTVSLNNSYTNPVVVASIRYPRSVTDDDQPAARVSNKTGSDFDVYTDNYSNDAPGTSTVDYLVLEAGEWLIDDGADGIRIYATSTNVSVSAGSGIPSDPGGTVVTYPTSFGSPPAVLTMVTSANDGEWTVSSVYDGNNISNPPTASELTVYLNDNLVSDGHGAAETVDVVVLDINSGTNNGVTFDVLNTATDVNDAPNTEPFNATFASTPQTTLVQQLTMNGAQGGYAQVDLDNPATVNDITITIEEGGPADRTHADEQVSIVAFEDSSGDVLRAGTAQVVSTPIDYDDGTVGNAWGEVSWNDTGDVTYHVEYNTGSGFADIPDSALPGNSSGFTSSPINILDLDTQTYNEIRLVADLSGIDPELYDWTVTWGERVDIPTLGDPFDNEKTADTTPTFDFTSSDPEGQSLEYEISYSTDPTFTTSSTTINSNGNSDFQNVTTPADLDPFNSGDTVSYTVPGGSALTDGETYWWRVRAKDPGGSDSFSPWSEPDNVTIDTSVSISTWFQTTQAQFQEGTVDGVFASSSDSVLVTSEIGEYGTTTVSGNDWTTINTQLNYDDMVVVASPQYDFDTSSDNGRTVQVRNKSSDSFQIKVENVTLSQGGSTDVSYIVMEAGDWTIEDGGSGFRIIAGTAADVSAVSGSNAGYNGGTTIDFVPDFSSTPAALATVSTNNGDKWVATVVDDGSQTGEITTDSMDVSLGIGYDSDTVRVAEDIDYLAFAPGTGNNNGVLFDALNSSDSVTDGDTAVSFNQTFSTLPRTIVVHNNATDGGDGGFAQVDTSTAGSASDVYLSIAEIPANGGHTTEIVSLLAFADAAGTIRRDASVGGGLIGTIASEAILFSDGLGPKFDRALFSATTPGNSTTSLQVQYQTATGSWALIPDGDLAGNSSGFTSSPVDLSAINVATYPVIRLLGSLACDTSDCPTLDDWLVEWSEGVTMSGTLQAYDRTTNVSTATVTVSVNGAAPTRTGTVSGGSWSIDNVTAFAGDVLTVFVDGVADANEAVGVFVYDGLGDMTGVSLYEGHLSLDADETQAVTLSKLGQGDNGAIGDEDVFFDVDGGGDLDVCGVGSCADNNLYVGDGNTFTVATSGSFSIQTHDFVNDGTVSFDANDMFLSGSWENNATSSMDTSAITFTASTGTETVTDVSGTLPFYDVTFGLGASTATWQTSGAIAVANDLAIDFGTLDRSSSTIAIAGALSIGASGNVSGIASTTFDGSGSASWTDNSANSQNMGHVLVDGTPRTVLLGSDVRAQTLTIGANDTLNAGGSNDIYVAGDFNNQNTFVPQTSRLVITDDGTSATITAGGSNLYGLRASTSAGAVSFTDTNLTVLDDISIATGTITLPTGNLSVGGSFTNEGGTFAHNNGTVTFVSTGSETITLLGTTFLNALYNVAFTGSGDWAFLDTNATTSGSLSISNGDVTLPSGQFSVARDFDVSGSGAFAANDGEVILKVQSSDEVTSNGSSFNDVRVQEQTGSLPWFNENWSNRIQLTIRASEVDDDLTNFPVYVDLSDFSSAFFSNLNADGGDIRVTEGDGTTEVPREVVSASTTAETGELYFRATSISSSTDTTFYIYYGNSGASDYAVTATNGAENVWSNGYVLVSHQNDETTSSVVNSADGSADGSKDVANQPQESTSGWIYEAQDFGGTGHIEVPNVGSGAANITISAWINPDNLTGSGDTSTYGFTIFSAHSSGNYTWLVAGGNGLDPNEISFCAFSSSASCDTSTGANLSTGEWRYVSATAVDGGAATIRTEETEVHSFTSDGGGAWNSVSTIGDLRPDREIEFEGLIDEVQISNVVRSVAWQDATYRNQATTTDFYAASAPQSNVARTFADTNMSIAGDLVLESGDVVFPTGVLSIAGSFDNDSEFDSNMGTVSFTTASGSATVAPGVSSFYNLRVDTTGGDLTITENATATNAINVQSAADFTVNSGITLESSGIFTNTASSSATTWTGSTLRLSSGGLVNVNTTAAAGDSYETIETTADTRVRWWNSDATTYNLGASSSVYSQDHAGVDGDLYIFGDYQRSSGTEYWQYDTDFDGTDLSGGSERQVNVRPANGAVVRITSSTLAVVGSSTASTTIDAQSGSYGWELQDATLSAQHFTATGGDAAGLQLLGSTTVSTFTNGAFTIPALSAAISLSSTTINANPDQQFFNLDFISGGGSTNVDLLDTPSAFWWFRDGSGDRYGEAFDNGDGNPGSVRWDDSNYLIDISGTVYSDNGSTPIGGPTCDGSTPNVRVVVDGGAYTDTTSCDGITGAYSFSNVSYIGDPVLHVYLDTGGGDTGATVTKTPTANITDLDVYENRLIARHEDTSPLTITDIAAYDTNDDTDLPYTAATSATPSLVTEGNTALYVWAGDTFSPEGPVTLASQATTNVYDGSLYLGASSTFTASGTTAYDIGGSLVVANGATLTTASSSFTFSATSTNNQVAASSTLTFNTLTFNGSGGEWDLAADVLVHDDLTVSAGTLTGGGDVTLSQGSFSGNGVVNLSSGTVQLNTDNTLGGTNSWTFNNLTLGDGSTAGITTPASAATTTVLDTLTIATGHFLDAGNAVFNLTGSGAVFVENGSFLEDTSTVQYSGSTPNILRTTYYNLLIDTTSGSVTATAPTTGLQILANLTVGATGTATLDLDSNDPTTSVAGDLTIGSSGTIAASDSDPLQTYGVWDNQGSFTANGGLVTFASPDAATITVGDSSFADVSFTGAGPYTMLSNATTTGTFTLGATTDYTQQSGTTLAVGGPFYNNTSGIDTTWTGSTLYLYSGTAFTIGDKTNADDYATVSVAANTHPRVWNSSFATVNTATNASLYAMDAAAVDGDLYIYGDYVNDGYDDSWSYATDWDGSSGANRSANVYVEAGGNVRYDAGSLAVIGTSSASTSISSFGGGDYSFRIRSTASTTWRYATPRDLDTAGIRFSGTPTVNDFSYIDVLVDANGATGVTVDGTVIDQNPAKNFNGDYFNASGSPSGVSNVTASGTTVSSWRFTNHSGNLDGEGNDSDGGDPGEIVWEDSALEITVSGNVYSDEGSTVSGVCDGSTSNITLRVAGLTSYSTSCDGSTGAYSIPSVSFSANDTLTLYIDGESEAAATISVDPVSNIANMDLYENRVIVRHEGADPITIADMAVWDSSNDGDIPFTAVTGAPDTLSLPADSKLIVWNNKEFAPDGDVTLSGGGGGSAVDGTLEVFPNGQFTAAGTESHEVNGSFIFDAGATFSAASSTITFSSTASGRTIDSNANAFHNVTVSGSGDWSVSDATFTVLGDYGQTGGTFTLPTATTTVAGDFDNSGGSVSANGGTLELTASDGGNTLRTNGSALANVRLHGGGSYAVFDANLTASGSVALVNSTLAMPGGTFTVGGDFTVSSSSTLVHNSGTLELIASSSAILTLSSNDLYALSIQGPGSFSMTDSAVALRHDLTVATGSLSVASNTLSIAGSLDATGGVLEAGSSTILFDSTDTGETVDPGANSLHHVVVSSPGGGWTFASATTTGNFSLTNANTFTLGSGEQLYVAGVFSNSVGGAATTWTGSNLVLNGPNEYSVSDSSVSDEVYGNLTLRNNADVRFWNSSFATTSLSASSSLYSQDHAGSDGALRIAGDYRITASNEHWDYATDFDGTTLSGGSRRAVTVTFDDTTSAGLTMTGGSLSLTGVSGATTTVSTLAAGTHALTVTGGTLSAAYYRFDALDGNGLKLSGTPTVSGLSNGQFVQGVDSAQLITLARTTLNANAGLLIDNVYFADGGYVPGNNVVLSATSTSAWQFRDHSGDLDGEFFDIDGTDDCGSIRWDNSDCQLLEQTSYRWRNNDGGLGVPTSEWFDSDWNKRQRVRLESDAASAYSSTSVEITVTYDSDMQSDFDDLRFTAADGVTEIPYWIEQVNTGVSAQVWLYVDTLPARDTATFFMYYDNVAADTTSSSTAVFTAVDDFEDGDIAEYSGDSFYEASSDEVYGGTYSLAPQSGDEGDRANSGIARFDQTVSQGERIRFHQYVDTSAGSDDETCALFAVQTPVTNNENYGVCLEQFGTDRFVLAENVESTDTYGSVNVLASSSVTYSTGWYEVIVDWQADNTIAASLYNPSGTLVATTSATDSTYTSGGFGFTSWGQNGAWDSFVSYPQIGEQPTVFFGQEQTEGGASWSATLNTPANIAALSNPIRLRVALENSGLDLTAQQYTIETAARGATPSCEAVDENDFSAVPVLASCGSSPICMATSTHFANNDPTTDLLLGSEGAFASGEAIEDPANQTASYDLDSNTYTEIEYALLPTVNVSDDAYCFRVTNDGTELDSYATIPELNLAFAPSVGAVNFNDGSTVTLTLGTTTPVLASTTVTDLNGYADITAATTTFYKSDVAGLADCTPDNNNCYRATLADSCSLSGCAGNSCALQCSADFAFHADPTDGDGGVFWYAYMEVGDSTDRSDFATSPANDVGTLRALAVQNAIDYGELGVNADTGSYNASTTIINLGNEAIDVDVQGTDLSDGAASVIDVSEQKFATSTFTYSGCVSCSQLNETGVSVEVDLSKPTTSTPPVSDELYWGINIPFGTNSVAHTGTNSFFATGD